MSITQEARGWTWIGNEMTKIWNNVRVQGGELASIGDKALGKEGKRGGDSMDSKK